MPVREGPVVKRFGWRTLALLAALAALWWFAALAFGCGPTRPTELPPPADNRE
jgi:hypothetical protein